MPITIVETSLDHTYGVEFTLPAGDYEHKMIVPQDCDKCGGAASCFELLSEIDPGTFYLCYTCIDGAFPHNNV